MALSGLLKELHWALVPIFIPAGPALIRWTLGLSLAALACYTWAGSSGLSELPALAVFLYAAFLVGHLYETLEVRVPFEGTRLEPLFSYGGKTTSANRFRWGIFLALPWAIGLFMVYHNLFNPGRGLHLLVPGLILTLAGYLGVRRVILRGTSA